MQPILEYIGAADGQKGTARRPRLLSRVPLPFLAVVVFPTLLASIYFLFIATPRYVSEARFVVRSAQSGGPGALGAALQGVGLAPAQVETFAVHEYVTSPDSLDELGRRFDLHQVYRPRGLDVWSGYPGLGEHPSGDGFRKAFRRYVTVGYDSTTGISTLRVQAFVPGEAQGITNALLEGGEHLVNRLNERSTADSVSGARAAQARATEKLMEAQAKMTAFRNSKRFIDPETTLGPASQILGSLMASVAQLRAERSQVARDAPQSPQLPGIDSRIASLEQQIAAEQARLTGGAQSIAPQVGTYEQLTFERELASKELATASAALISAEQSARRQQLYLERIVQPTLPETPSRPRRWFSILAVLLSTLFAYGLGWLILAGVREHKQD
jgi:capsular polysaccharide transport system permease protein